MRLGRLPLALLVTAALAVALPGCAPEPADGPSGSGAPSAPPTTASPAPTEPAPADPDQQRAQRAAELVAAMSLEDRAASVIMGAAPGTDAAALHDYVAGNHLGGFILMGGNIPSGPDALWALTGRLAGDPAFPTLIAVDQEGGEVSRLPWDDHPGADLLKSEPARQTERAFHARAELLVQAGINVNFGVVADVPSGPSSFIYGRALGTTPGSAAKRVAAAVDGEQLVAEQGGSGQRRGMVASTLKHFPGHGAAEGDSHTGVPSTSLSLADWRRSHAKPFEAGIAAGAELLMFGHLAYTSVDAKPASLSRRWHRIARDELGFTGVIVSDDLGMLLSSGVPAYADITKVVVKSLAAGTDLALVIQGVDPASMPGIVDGVAAAVKSGALPQSRLDEAATRVAELRLRIAEATGSGAAANG